MSLTIAGREYDVWIANNVQTYRRAGARDTYYLTRIASPYGTIFVLMHSAGAELCGSIQEADRAITALEDGEPATGLCPESSVI